MNNKYKVYVNHSSLTLNCTVEIQYSGPWISSLLLEIHPFQSTQNKTLERCCMQCTGLRMQRTGPPLESQGSNEYRLVIKPLDKDTFPTCRWK